MKNNSFMSKQKNIKTALIGGIATLLVLTSHVVAAQQGHIKVTSQVQKMEIVKKDGKTSYMFLPAAKVLPGEMVQYNTIYETQLLTYLRLMDLRVGLVINFGERVVKDGIHRVINSRLK